jgi:hypothetical protein
LPAKFRQIIIVFQYLIKIWCKLGQIAWGHIVKGLKESANSGRDPSAGLARPEQAGSRSLCPTPLRATATTNEIKAAYREKIKQYHPDLVSGLGEKLRRLAESESQKLKAAKDEGLILARG